MFVLTLNIRESVSYMRERKRFGIEIEIWIFEYQNKKRLWIMVALISKIWKGSVRIYKIRKFLPDERELLRSASTSTSICK